MSRTGRAAFLAAALCLQLSACGREGASAADLESASSVVTAPEESLDDAGPATAQMPLVEEASLFADPTPSTEDPFLAQLREAMARGGEDSGSDEDALAAFFDQEPEDEGRSWFGRRR